MSINLYPHNQTAYENAVRMMREHGKAAVIHPTGTGKSFIAFKLAEDNPGAKMVWLAPSEYIFRAQRENYLEAGGEEKALGGIVFLTYAKLMYGMAEMEDDAEQEDTAGTKADDEARKETGAKNAQRAEAGETPEPGDRLSGLENPDYIILDEFHRCGAEGWGRGVELLLQNSPSAKVLGLSATHIRYLDNRRDMAGELFDGRIASRMELAEAVSRGILPAPLYICGLYEYGDELDRMTRRVKSQRHVGGTRDESAKLLEKLRHCLEQAEGPEKIFARYMKKDGKYIVFCSGREHMDEMIRLAGKWYGGLNGEPVIYRAIYDNQESPEEVRRFRTDQSDRLKLLFCIDMLNEGVHVADVDGAVLLRPTASPILYLQQVGRALSVPGGDTEKQPVIFDMVDNFDGLRCIDSFLEEYRRVSNGDGGKKKDRASYRFRLIDEARDSRRLFEQLGRCLASSWDTCFQEAERYYAEHGNLKVPKRYITEEGIALGSWLVTQRRVRAGAVPGTLSEEQIERLDRLEMVWESRIGKAWQTGYRELQKFYQENGHVDVPGRYMTEDGYPLGRFVTNQRAAWRKSRENAAAAEGSIQTVEPEERRAQAGEPEDGAVQSGETRKEGDRSGNRAAAGSARTGRSLTEEKKRQLDALGFIWDKTEQSWDRYYEAAKTFYAREGHLDVPAKYVTEEGLQLGVWIRKKALEKDALPAERVRELEAIGMVWGGRYDGRWDEKFRLAKEYYQENGNLEVPKEYQVKGVRLGRWINALRSAREKPESSHYRLDEERIRQLDSIGMHWGGESWEVRYRLAERYYLEKGNLKIAQTYVAKEGETRIWLGKWLAEQRKKHGGSGGKRVLTEEQERRLEAIGMEW